jgi:hypothetical protein
MEAGTSAAPQEPGYPGAAVAGAVLATLFFPLFALIAALLLMGGQTNPAKRSALRTWAWASGGWMVLQIVFFVVLATATFSHSSGTSDRSGPCVGGPKLNATGTQVPGSKNKFVVPCEISGTQTITFP